MEGASIGWTNLRVSLTSLTQTTAALVPMVIQPKQEAAVCLWHYGCTAAAYVSIQLLMAAHLGLVSRVLEDGIEHL
jgi:hypothetical protein